MKKFVKRLMVSVLAFVMVLQCAYVGSPVKEVQAAQSDDNSYSAEYVIQNWGKSPADEEGKLFVGWYMDSDYTEPLKRKPTEYTEGQTFYAKYVDEDLFGLKLQVEKLSNGKYNLRLISSVDSLDYNKVGFNVTFKNQTFQVSSTSVYKNVDSVYMDKEYSYSPKIVNVDSEYMFTSIVKNVSANDIGKDFYVVPYVQTMGGTMLYGPSRMFSIRDGISEDMVNLSVKANKPMTSSVKVMVGETETTAEVVGHTEDGYLHLNVSVDRATLDSNTKVTYEDESIVYHNLESSNTIDTSWYDANEDEYVIATEADLYGLRDLVNNSQIVFTGKTLYMISDLTLNEVDESTYNAWVAGTKVADNKWAPIGYWATNSEGAQVKVYFDGTFDGQGHSIQGLYGTNASFPIGGAEYYGYGLFTGINSNGAVKNLEIDYCYFNPNVNGIGTIAAILWGTIDNVHVGEHTYIGTTKLAKGGIAGRTYGGTFSNVWFEGTIQGSASTGYLGGIVGQVDNYSFMKNALFTGKINLTNAGTNGNGGLVGHIFAGASVEFNNCLYAGTMTNTANDKTGVASIVGYIKSGAHAYMNNVYMMSKPSDASSSVIAEESGVLGVGYRESATASYVNGNVVMPTAYTDLYQTFLFDYWNEYNENGAWAAPKAAGALPVLKAFSGLTKDEIQNGNSGTTPGTAWYTSKLYAIRSVSDLYGLADLVNNQGVSMEGVTIALREDLDLNPGWNAASGVAPENGRVWEPIGTVESPFKGIFTGANHTISGLYMTADQGYQGLFGYVDSGSVKNVKIENSYYDFTSKTTGGHEGSVVGCLKKGMLYNVIADVDIATVNGYTGGIVGSVEDAKVQNVWYKGNITVENEENATVKAGYGAIVGSVTNGYVAVTNSMFDGTMTVNRAGNYYAAGLVGTANAGTKVSVKESLAIGSLTFADITEKDNTNVTVEIESVYTTAPSQEQGVKVLTNGVADELIDDARTWINRYNASGALLAPELNKNDGVIRVLLIGNSFCYYHTDELYGMLASDGSEAIVANVYESGCPVKDHWTWLNSGAEKYNYITVTSNGRKDYGLKSLKYCLAQEDWDVISLQQHFNPGNADTYEGAANTIGTLQYAKLLYDYLKEYHPQSRLVWQQTWAYQIGYKGPSNTTSSDTSQHVLTVEKQTTNYENIRDTAIEVCRQNNVTRVPNGDAWQIARGVVGDILCDKSGTDLAEDTKVGDNYHDGDIGGGQLLNAYGFYEIITGMDCRDNTYLPPYADAMLINSEFNPELQTTTDVINALKEAAHSAVEAMK